MDVENYPEIYKVDSAGKLRVWYMQREGHRHRVVAGVRGGALVENGWTECVSKGKGKAQTTPVEQAIKEIDALYEKALKRDYYATPEEAAGPPRNYLPMLAESWKATTWEKWTARLQAPLQALLPINHTGVYFQPKLDGFCCVAKAGGLQSREGLPILTADHVRRALEPFFAQYPDAVLHGELYNHDLKEEFEKLASLLKRQKDITDDHRAEVEAKVQFHIYDYPESGEAVPRPFWIRTLGLHAQAHGAVGASNGVLHLVETTPVRDEEHLLELTSQALVDGYEGGIGRLNLLYEKAKRSWSVIKIKTFMDDEFGVAQILEGIGNYAGYAKAVICWKPGADRSEGPTRENTFKASIKGKRDQWLADLLHAGHKLVTIRFFGYTHGGTGVPRMGVATKWHGDERVL